MILHVVHFSIFRDARGSEHEHLETQAATPRALFDELFAGTTVPGAPEAWARVAVNGDFAAWDARLAEGDTVVFLAPSAGG